MTTPRLTRDDWIAAALDRMASGGPSAVAVEPLAKTLGATKGSFYWHFENRADLLGATLAAWEQIATDGVIDHVERVAEKPLDRARVLLERVMTHGFTSSAEVLLLAAANADTAVRAAVERVTQRRIRYVADVLEQSGAAPAIAGRRALLAYSTYLGQAQLGAAVPALLPGSAEERKALIDEMVALLAPAPAAGMVPRR